MRVDHFLDIAHMAGIEDKIDGEQRRPLQRNTTAPALARRREHRPGEARLRPYAVDMRADRGCPMRIGALERKLHAALDIPGAPMRETIRPDRRQRAGEGSVRIGRARPDMTFVEMGVRIDEQWQRDGAGERQSRQVGGERALARWSDRGDPAVGDNDIDKRQALRIGRGERLVEQRARNPRLPKRIVRRPRRGEPRAHVSRPRALSCQRRNSACDTALSRI